MFDWRPPLHMLGVLIALYMMVFQAAADVPARFGPSKAADLRIITEPANLQTGFSDPTVSVVFLFKGRHLGAPLTAGTHLALRPPPDFASPSCTMTYDDVEIPMSLDAAVTVIPVSPISAHGTENNYTLQYTLGQLSNDATYETLLADTSAVFSLNCTFTRPAVRVYGSMIHAALAVDPVDDTDSEESDGSSEGSPDGEGADEGEGEEGDDIVNTVPIVIAETYYNLPTPEIQGHLLLGPFLTIAGVQKPGQIVTAKYAFSLSTGIKWNPVVHVQLPQGFRFSQFTIGNGCAGQLTPTEVQFDPVSGMARVSIEQNLISSLVPGCELEFVGGLSDTPTPAMYEGLFMITNSESCFSADDDILEGSCNLFDPLSTKDASVVLSRTLLIPAITEAKNDQPQGLLSSKPTVTFSGESVTKDEVTLTIAFENALGVTHSLSSIVRMHVSFRDTPSLILGPVSLECKLGTTTVSGDYETGGLNLHSPAIWSQKSQFSISCVIKRPAYVASGPDAVTISFALTPSSGEELIAMVSAPAPCSGFVRQNDNFDTDDNPPKHLKYLAEDPLVTPGTLVKASMLVNIPKNMEMSTQPKIIADFPSSGYDPNTETPSCTLTSTVANFYKTIKVVYFPVSPSYSAPGYFRAVFTVSRLGHPHPRQALIPTLIECTGIRAPLRTYNKNDEVLHGRVSFFDAESSVAARARVMVPITTDVSSMNLGSSIFKAEIASDKAHFTATGEISFTIKNEEAGLRGAFVPGSAVSIFIPKGYTISGLSSGSRAAVGPQCFFKSVDQPDFEVALGPEDMFFSASSSEDFYESRFRFPLDIDSEFMSPFNTTSYEFRCMYDFPNSAVTSNTIPEMFILSPVTPGNGKADISKKDVFDGFMVVSGKAESSTKLNLTARPSFSGDILGYEKPDDLDNPEDPGKYPRDVTLDSNIVGAYTMFNLDLAVVNAELGLRGYNMFAQEHFSLVLPELIGWLPYTQCFAAWDNATNHEMDPFYTDHFRLGVPSQKFPSATSVFMGTPRDRMSVIPKGFFRISCAMRNPMSTMEPSRGLTALFDFRTDPLSITHSIRFPKIVEGSFDTQKGANTLSYEGFGRFDSFGGFLRFTLAPQAYTGSEYQLELEVPAGTLKFVVGRDKVFEPSWIQCSVDNHDPLPLTRVSRTAVVSSNDPPNVIVVPLPPRAVHWPEDDMVVSCSATAAVNKDEGKVITLPGSMRLGDAVESSSERRLPYTSATLRAPVSMGGAVISSIKGNFLSEEGVATLPTVLVPEVGAERKITPADYNSTNWVEFRVAALVSEIPKKSMFDFYLPRVKGAAFAPPHGVASDKISCELDIAGQDKRNVSSSIKHVYIGSSDDTPAEELPVPGVGGEIEYGGEDIGYTYSILSVPTPDALPASSAEHRTYVVRCYLLHPAALIDKRETRIVLRATEIPKHVFIDANDADFVGVFYMEPPEVLPIEKASVVPATASQFARTDLTITVTGVPLDMFMYDYIEVEFPETHLFEMLPSKKGKVIAPTPSAANDFVHAGEEKEDDDKDPSSADVHALSLAHSRAANAVQSPYWDNFGPVTVAPVSESLARARRGGPPVDQRSHLAGFDPYRAFSLLDAGSEFDESTVDDSKTTFCTVNGYPALSTVPPSWSVLSETVTVDPCITAASDPESTKDPIEGRCSARSFAVALPFDLPKRADKAGTSAVTIKCSNVRTPMASPLVDPTSGEDKNRVPGLATVRLVRPPYTSKSNYSIPLLMAERKNVQLDPIVVPEWGETMRTVTPSNVTVRSDHGLLTVAIQPVPMDITNSSEIAVVLPHMWTLQPADRDSSHSGELCRASVDTPVTTQAKITGEARLVNTSRTITFWPMSEPIAATDKILRIFCDGVRVPLVPQTAMNKTELRVTDFVTQYGNAAATLADVGKTEMGKKWLLTALTTHADTPEIITGLAPRAFVSHILSIELRQPLNSEMLKNYVSQYMKVLGEATDSLFVTAAIRKNVLVKVPVIIDDPKNVEEDVYVDVEIIFEGASNTNNFDVQRIVQQNKVAIAANIANLTNTFIVRNPDPEITEIPGTCYNSELDPGEASTDCGSVCMACDINSICNVDEDCLTSTCIERTIPGVGRERRCEERPLVPIKPKPKPNSATLVGSGSAWAILALIAAVSVSALIG